jgi:hypothetical protein
MLSVSRPMVNCAPQASAIRIGICHAAVPIDASVNQASSGINSGALVSNGEVHVESSIDESDFLDNKFAFKWNSTGRTVAGVTASHGTSAHLLKNPGAIAFDRWDNMYVADKENHRVQRWTPSSTNGTTVAGRQDCVAGNSLSHLFAPFGLAVDNSGGVYVADTYNDRVVY